jgi:hypothetical protein
MCVLRDQGRLKPQSISWGSLQLKFIVDAVIEILVSALINFSVRFWLAAGLEELVPAVFGPELRGLSPRCSPETHLHV